VNKPSPDSHERQAQRLERLERRLERLAPRSPRALTSGPLSARERGGDRLVIEPVGRDRPIPLALAQERFWFLHQLDPASPADNVAVALGIEGRLDPDLYQRAWDAIIERHEILRTRFPADEGGRPSQVIEPPRPAVIRYVDLRNSSLRGAAAVPPREARSLRPEGAVPPPRSGGPSASDSERSLRGAAAVPPAAEPPVPPREARSFRREAAVLAAADEADRPFDLANGPVYRLTVYRLEDELFIALGAFHHIVCDLWSLGVISHELVELYSAFQEKRAPRLPPLSCQYADYAVCHRRWVDGPAVEQQLDYWRQRLDGAQTHELPSDRPRQSTRGVGATGVRDLPGGLMDAVRALAAREGATPFMVLIAAFACLLSRYTGHHDVVLGTPIANRTKLALKGLIGTFVNTLVFDLDVSGARTFRELLGRAREVALGAFARQDVSFHRLVTELQADRSTGRSPFFQVLFNVQNAPVKLPQLPGMRIAHVTLPRRAAQFDLTVWVDTDVLNQVGYAWDTSLFDADTIERLIAHYVTLLGRVVADPDVDPAELDLLSADEERQVLRDWNQTSRDYPAETLVDMFRRQARETPDAPAIVAYDATFREATDGRLKPAVTTRATTRAGGAIAAEAGATATDGRLKPAATTSATTRAVGATAAGGVTAATGGWLKPAVTTSATRAGGTALTYRELAARGAAMAAHLESRGAGPGTLVGVCLNRGVDLVAALLGILESGAAYLPLDPSLPLERLALTLEDAGARLVVTEPALAGLLPSTAELVLVQAAFTAFDESMRRPGPETRPLPSDLAYVIYTSGSGGRPKGVEISHAALANFLQGMRERPGLARDDRLLAVTTVSFDIAALEIYLPLVTGATVVIADRGDTHDAARLAALIDRERVTVMQTTPATWRMLVDHGWPGAPHLTILCGGEALPRDLAEHLLTRGRALWNLFGPTETTIWSTVEQVTSGEGPVSIGRPIANTQAYVLDPRLKPVPPGVHGDLYIGGDGVATGYRRRPDLTAERFVANPFADRPGGRMYRTGDRARFLADGRLEWLGRADRQVKIRGFRVEPEEIESCLTDHPGIRSAAIVAHLEAEGTGRLWAFVVRAPSSTLDAVDIRSYLARHLPSYMVPSRVSLVPELPLTPNGKVDRKRLLNVTLIPEPPEAESSTTGTERRVASIWADALGVSSIGLDDDFFDLGGHSLLAVRVVARVERELGCPLSVATLLDARTVRQLAAVVDHQREAPAWKALVMMQRDRRAADAQAGPEQKPFFCLHGIGGEVVGYEALAARMGGTDRPFIGVQAVNEVRSGSPAEGVATQAARYVDEIRRYQPRGPYYLGGYSHGGRVALEMALQLEAQGQQVAFLGIIDTTPFRVYYSSPRYWWRVLRNAPLWFRYDAVRTPWRENVDRVRRAWRILRCAVVGHPGANAKPGLIADVRDTMNIDELPPTFQDHYEWDFEAFSAYRPSAKCGPVTVFRAVGQPLLASHDPDLGWGAVSRGPVTVVNVRGNHSSILAEPDVEGLAAALDAALLSAQQDTRSARLQPDGNTRSVRL
jgi:amino acid adenylation domain-containing protein